MPVGPAIDTSNINLRGQLTEGKVGTASTSAGHASSFPKKGVAMATHLVTLAFDLQNADSDDYDNADRELAKLGLTRQLQATNGTTVTLPYNTYAGEFTGVTAAQVRNDVRNLAMAALQQCQVTGKLFVAVGGNWAWGAAAV